MSTPQDQLNKVADAARSALATEATAAETKAIGFVQRHYYWFILGAFIAGIAVRSVF